MGSVDSQQVKLSFEFLVSSTQEIKAKPKSAVIFLPRTKEINRLQYRLMHRDIPSVLGCMIPKLNRGNKQVSVASLKAVCNMLLAVLVKLPWLTGTADPQPHPCHLLSFLREGRTDKCVLLQPACLHAAARTVAPSP